MTYQRYPFNHQSEKSMSEDQLDQIIDAILGGKYSWACVLLLRFVGYNPLHYIPYRTYNRLMKQNGLGPKSKAKENSNSNLSAQNREKKIADLAYLDSAKEQCSAVSGGSRHLEVCDQFWIR